MKFPKRAENLNCNSALKFSKPSVAILGGYGSETGGKGWKELKMYIYNLNFQGSGGGPP